MSKIILSVCSRSAKPAKSLAALHGYSVPGVIQTRIAYDAPSWYDGHAMNSLMLDDDDDIIVLSHDDIEILSNHPNFYNALELCKKPSTGFIGVAGGTLFDGPKIGGAWWRARELGASRGFVFQGNSNDTMRPNWFGDYGQVVVLDGCFLACSFRTLIKVGLNKPKYLTSGWDFYDIYMTSRAHLLGLNNYAVPLIVRHESPGEMRREWFEAKDQFLKHNAADLPITLNYSKTNGIPK